MQLNMVPTSIHFAVEIPMELFREHLLNDDCEDNNLCDALHKISGVDNVEYNGHFMNFVYFRLDTDEDTPDKRKEILDTIKRYINL